MRKARKSPFHNPNSPLHPARLAFYEALVRDQMYRGLQAQFNAKTPETPRPEPAMSEEAAIKYLLQKSPLKKEDAHLLLGIPNGEVRPRTYDILFRELQSRHHPDKNPKSGNEVITLINQLRRLLK